MPAGSVTPRVTRCPTLIPPPHPETGAAGAGCGAAKGLAHRGTRHRRAALPVSSCCHTHHHYIPIDQRVCGGR